MSKSKYPNKIDTSVELPIARDNVTQVTSEIFNSLRSAIINIEKTLGLLPNGDETITVSDRLNNSLDELGNIKASAISALNLLSGPITNKDVQENARIEESKLDLNFSTNTLYGQNISLRQDLEDLIGVINDLALRLSIHLNKTSLSQHAGIQVDIAQNRSVASNIATINLADKDLQTAIEDIYNRHINLLSTDINESNYSHRADQIYFNSEESTLTATNVQDAIEESSGVFGDSLNDKFGVLNSNGRIIFGKEYNPDDEFGLFPITDYFSVAFTKSDEEFFEINLVSPFQEDSIKSFDIFQIRNINQDVDLFYKIKSVKRSTSGLIEKVELFGSLLFTDDGSFLGRFLNNNYTTLKRTGLLATARPNAGRSSTPYVVCENPNSANITSKGAKLFDLSTTVRNLKVVIDGNEYDIDVYNASISKQTIESVVFKINEYAADNNLPITCSKVKEATNYEISISHMIPESNQDLKERTLEIKTTSNDASTALGFSETIGTVFSGSENNSFFINGEIKNSIMETTIYTRETFNNKIGSNIIRYTGSDLSLLNIRKGDFVYIDSPDLANSGCFPISAISSTEIELDNLSFSFTSVATDETQYIFLKCGSFLGGLTLENPSVEFMLVDTIHEKTDVASHKRLEYSLQNFNAGFSFSIVNISSGFIIEGQTATIEIDTSYNLTFTDPLGNVSVKNIKNDGFHTIYSADKLSFIEIFVVGTETSLTSTVNSDIYGYNEASENVYRISRSTYSTSMGFVLGADSGLGVSTVLDKRRSGTIKSFNISDQFYEKIIEGPRNELTSAGYIKGVSFSGYVYSSGEYTLNISSGVFYVNGIRKEFSGVEDFKHQEENIPVDLSKVIFYFNKHGILSVREVLTTESDFYFNIEENLVLAWVDTSDTSVIYDGRFFINQNDRKLSNEIIVSKDENVAHFTDLQKAINYVGFVSETTGECPSIYINDLNFEIDSTITIDTDLTVRGSQRSTLVFTGTGQGAPGADVGLNLSSSVMFYIPEGKSISFDGITFESEDNPDVFTFFCLNQVDAKKVLKITNCNFQSSNLSNLSDKIRIPVLFQETDPSDNLDGFSSTLGGLIFCNNFVYNMGSELGLIYALFNGSIGASSLLRIIISNNIVTSASPTLATTIGSYEVLMVTNDLQSGAFILPTAYEEISITGNTYAP